MTGLIVSELPYLCICAVLYFATWYYVVDFPKDSHRAGSTLFVMIFYEFLYTGIGETPISYPKFSTTLTRRSQLGQAIAAYAPSSMVAALMNPM